MFQLVKVLVERGVYNLDKPFTYAYLGEERLSFGMRVNIDFNSSSIVGFIVDEPEVINEDFQTYLSKLDYSLKTIQSVLDKEPIIDKELYELAKKVADYYLCPLIEVLKAMLPPSLKPNSSSKSKPQLRFQKVALRKENTLGIKLNSNQEKLYLELDKETPVSKIGAKASLKFLVDNSLVEIIDREVKTKLSLEDEGYYLKTLTEEQENAFDKIINSSDSTFLIQGVTGSGKTEIYLHLVSYYLKRGKSSIVLVPEISLTDKMISLFYSVFNNQVAIFHSGLSNKVKYDEYRSIARGEKKVVIGTRSAIFAPVKDLGLIVVDEEHVESYKQDTSPYYDARRVALMLSEKTQCKVIYASATPSLEMKAMTESKRMALIKLNKRINENELPEVQIVSLNDYVNINDESAIISRPLVRELESTFASNHQAILLLNRRGYAPIYTCDNCKKTLVCPNCSVPLVYHKKSGELRCHHCDYSISVSSFECPKCHGTKFSYNGFGTERIKDDLERIFPQIKVGILDADSTRLKGEYHRILSDFALGKYDVLVGTQMVAKGHDFSNVTLAVALMADQSLEFPSYKANENTFDMLTQLIGRAGRGDFTGKAIVQTYSKDNKVIELASKQDYEAFYVYEMKNRQARNYPPYCYLANITLSSSKRDKVVQASYQVKNFLVNKLVRHSLALVYGPSVPYIEKLNNRYYRKLMLKYKNRLAVKRILKDLIDLKMTSSEIHLSIDIDPSSDI